VITLHVENLILELKEAYKRESDILFHLDDLAGEHKEYQEKLKENQRTIALLREELECFIKE
jgi:5-methylcytosine-specific restriction endonuclease McrA